VQDGNVEDLAATSKQQNKRQTIHFGFSQV
jgi:hypothetical protein